MSTKTDSLAMGSLRPAWGVASGYPRRITWCYFYRRGKASDLRHWYLIVTYLAKQSQHVHKARRVWWCTSVVCTDFCLDCYTETRSLTPENANRSTHAKELTLRVRLMRHKLVWCPCTPHTRTLFGLQNIFLFLLFVCEGSRNVISKHKILYQAIRPASS